MYDELFIVIFCIADFLMCEWMIVFSGLGPDYYEGFAETAEAISAGAVQRRVSVGNAEQKEENSR